MTRNRSPFVVDEAPQVLIVDDLPANLLALETLLDGLDCLPVCATSGEQAIELLLQRTFAVALLDVRMPEIDGYEVARHARRHAATRDLPIIFLTAEAPADELARDGYASGGIDFLFKPLDRQVVRSKVSAFLDLFASRLELTRANARLRDTNAKLLALVEAETTTSSALRQANDELGHLCRHLLEPSEGTPAGGQ